MKPRSLLLVEPGRLESPGSFEHDRSPRRRWARLGAALFVAVLLAPPTAAARQQEELPPGIEGPLANDAFLPTGSAGEDPGEALATGDELLLRSRSDALEERPDDVQRLRREAFETWHRALLENGSGASLWDTLTRVPRRRTIGVRQALVQRLRGLAPRERELWIERVRDSSERSLTAALESEERERDLAEVHALFPATPAATRAALFLGDLAFERGTENLAALWWAQAQAAHALVSEPVGSEDVEDLGSLPTRLEARRARLTAAGPSRAPAAWEAGSSLRLAGSLPLLSSTGAGRAGSLYEATWSSGGGARAGLCEVSRTQSGARTIAVQTRDAVHLVRLGEQGVPELVDAFSPELLVPDGGTRFDWRTAEPAPGWDLSPAASDGVLFLVQGREPRSERGNALIAVTPPAPGGLSVLVESNRPKLQWAVVGNRHFDAGGHSAPVPGLEELPGLEFQPGPVVAGDRICVQAREYGGEVRAWVLAFDRLDGSLRWSRLLGTGTDLTPASGAGWVGLRLAGSPLLATAEHLFIPTNLGLGALVELASGAPVWSLRNRRRPAAERGWISARPTRFGAGILWAPFDSDRLYPTPLPDPNAQLELGVEADPTPVPSLARGESRTLLGGNPNAVVVQGHAGPERTVSIRGQLGVDRIDALYLGPAEEFAGRGLAGERRVVVSSDRGVYLFDRERELYLLDYLPLASSGRRTGGGSSGADLEAIGGSVHAVGRFLVVLGRGGLWSLVVESSAGR